MPRQRAVLPKGKRGVCHGRMAMLSMGVRQLWWQIGKTWAVWLNAFCRESF